MKRINEYKKLFEVEGELDLKTLKTKYRNLVKEWHPDKFQKDDPKAAQAEEMSLKIIDGYHFLVSIAPETKEANLEDFNKTLETSGIADFQHKRQVLEVTFLDGSTYEFFGVSTKLYGKMVNADKIFRFAKRNIFNSHLYRRSKTDALAK